MAQKSVKKQAGKIDIEPNKMGLAIAALAASLLLLVAVIAMF